MRGYGWDDKVQDEIANKIEGWFEHLKGLAQVKIPRCLRSSNSEPVKSKRIVTFIDASQQAYGAAIYGKDFRPFVANRIGEIQMFTEPSQWHALTEENPADLCTRGATPSELADSSLWWISPEWLTKDFKEWSKMQDPNRPREMPEKKTSQRKEDTNGCTTLLTNNLQKKAASKQDDKLEVWNLIRNGFPVGYVYFEYTQE